MSVSAQHVATLVAASFEASLVVLRQPDQEAHVFLTEHSDTEFVVSLEVSRSGGDWQRNLIVALEPGATDWSVEVRITDDEQLPIARIGHAEVAADELAAVTLSMAQAGVARLAKESTASAVA
jgi:hypothetical protein